MRPLPPRSPSHGIWSGSTSGRSLPLRSAPLRLLRLLPSARQSWAQEPALLPDRQQHSKIARWSPGPHRLRRPLPLTSRKVPSEPTEADPFPTPRRANSSPIIRERQTTSELLLGAETERQRTIPATTGPAISSPTQATSLDSRNTAVAAERRTIPDSEEPNSRSRVRAPNPARQSSRWRANLSQGTNPRPK